uniref:Uncharacterized protein n=1 Tax=Setaria italica TaxID=4555 RepID=K4A487_SETIT
MLSHAWSLCDSHLENMYPQRSKRRIFVSFISFIHMFSVIHKLWRHLKG